MNTPRNTRFELICVLQVNKFLALFCNVYIVIAHELCPSRTPVFCFKIASHLPWLSFELVVANIFINYIVSSHSVKSNVNPWPLYVLIFTSDSCLRYPITFQNLVTWAIIFHMFGKIYLKGPHCYTEIDEIRSEAL